MWFELIELFLVSFIASFVGGVVGWLIARWDIEERQAGNRGLWKW